MSNAVSILHQLIINEEVRSHGNYAKVIRSHLEIVDEQMQEIWGSSSLTTLGFEHEGLKPTVQSTLMTL